MAGSACCELNAVMRAVAAGHFARTLAAAEADDSCFLGFEFHWTEAAAFVRPIAEWLCAALPTRAPPIGLTRLNLDLVGAFLRDQGQCFRHRCVSPIACQAAP